jgi:Spy/CpxP family protein refolding chaperone
VSSKGRAACLSGERRARSRGTARNKRRPHRIASLIGVFLLGAALLPAQTLPVRPGWEPAQLKAYLNLTESQIGALQQVQRDRMAAEQAIYQQINEKQRALNVLLQSGSQNATQIGQLMIDIAALQKQVPLGASYRESALAILSADQRAKLPALVLVRQQQSVAWEAVNWNLIDAPQPRTTPTPRTR